MSEVCNTVKVKSTHPETQGAFVEINEEDFNEAIHELYVESSEEPAPAEKKLTKAEEAAKAKAEADAAKANESQAGWGKQ